MPRWFGRYWCRPRCACWVSGTGGRHRGSDRGCVRGHCMHRASLLLLLLVVGCARPVAPLPPVPRSEATPVPPVEFPRDFAPHDALTEWWYYTGHLYTESGREYGFEFTIFQARRQAAPSGYLAHFAISDIGA